MNKYKIMAIGSLAVLTLVIPVAFVHAGPNSQLVNLNFPCPSSFGNCVQLSDAASSSNPIGTFLNSFYQIALGLSGILALLMIVYGGVKYTISAGNAGGQEDARDIILSAIYGVALLLASYLILNTINPQITTLTLPGVGFNQVATSSGVSVPITECIPLNAQTADPNNSSTLSADATYASMANPTTYLGGGNYDSGSSADDPATANCQNRVFYTRSTLTLTSDKDYYSLGLGNIVNLLNFKSGTVVINPGSEIWQYPYFPGSATTSGAVAVGARCLIYAYQEMNSSGTSMIGLNPSLELCYPHNQSMGAIAPSSDPKAFCNPIYSQCGCSALQCLDLSSTGLPNKGPLRACNDSLCLLNSGLVIKMQAAYRSPYNGWQISEAWPPTVVHASLCHNIGTCADVVLTKTPLDCGYLNNVMQSFFNQGLGVLNEYSQCGGSTFETTTGSNLHVELCSGGKHPTDGQGCQN